MDIFELIIDCLGIIVILVLIALWNPIIAILGVMFFIAFGIEYLAGNL